MMRGLQSSSVSVLRICACLCVLADLTSGQQNFSTTAHVLIYSATADFRHDSIPTAIRALQSKGASYDIRFDNTEDQTWFTTGRINEYDAIIFLDNTGEVLDDQGEAALQNYVNLGGNFVGIHSASDCQRNSSFFQKELGAHFDYHPPIQNATINVIDTSHPSTSMLPARWDVYDEMYNFKSDPRSIGATVLLSADESTYTDPGPRKFDQGSPHPTAWFQDRGAGVSGNGVAGRSWYTSLGHTNETWMDEVFLSHVMGGISWTLQSNTTRATNPAALVGPGSNSTSTPSVSATSSSPGTSQTSNTSNTSSALLTRVTPTQAAIITTFLLGVFALCF